MPGQIGAIRFSKPKGSMYLGTTIGIFRTGDDFRLTRIGHSDTHLRVCRDGAITNGQMLFRLLDALWQRENEKSGIGSRRDKP